MDEPETPPAVTPKPQTTETETEHDTDAPAEGTPPTATTPADKKKLSPWKLVDEHKAARLKAETELAELRKTMVDPVKVKETEERAAKIEARAKELEDHIRFVDYSKSQEYNDKYEKPYQDQWTKAMSELGELTIADPNTGQERAIAPTDILELVNMPLKDARARAVEQFGDFADDVMAQRKEIRNLFDAKSKALEEARKSGAERMTKQQQEFQVRQEALGKEIKTTWAQANESAAKDEKFGKFFTQVEGDEEGNTRLKKGFEIADKAFSVSPLDPRLTPEQRAEVVRLHSAIRNRAAAFGRLSYQNEKLVGEVAALKAELDKFKGVQPGAGEGQRDRPEAATGSARDQVFGALQKLAH